MRWEQVFTSMANIVAEINCLNCERTFLAVAL